MPLSVKIQRELTGGYFVATGKITYTGADNVTQEGPAEVLIKKVTDTEYVFEPNHALFKSNLNGKVPLEVFHCMPAAPNKKGVITFSKFHIKFQS